MTRSAAFPLAAALVLLASACGSLKPPPAPASPEYFRSEDGNQLASIHLATVQIWPWDSVSQDIQPTFRVNVTAPESALAITSGSSSQYTESIEQNIGASYRLSTPASAPSPKNPSHGTSSAGSGDSGNSGAKQTPEQTPGSANSHSSDTGTTSGTASGATASSGSSKSGAGTGTTKANPPSASQPAIALADALTQLQATNALFQEAGLLNNFTSGLIQRRNYIPYVIRLQLTVLPYHRREPYDLFVDLKMALMDPKKEGYHLPSIIIIPLLVTDSIEESSENITKEAISRLQAQLSAGVGPAELTASVQHAIDSIKTSLSNRPNSLFAIGKLGTGDDAGIRVRIGANRFGDEFELEPKTHSISFVALVSRDTFEVNKDVLTRSMVIYASPTYRYALPTSLNTTKEQTAKEITGATVADTFVLEAAPKVGSGPTPDSEIWCPPDQTVVVTENSDGAQGSIYGVRDWGSRPVHGYLNAYSTDNGKLIASFASKSAFRDVDGTIPLRFSDFSDALDKKTTKIWKLDIQVDRLRTDELYPSDNHPKEHPWVECGPPLKAVVVPNKKPLTGSADASGARTAPQKHGTSAPGAGSSSPEPKTSSKNSNASGAAPK